MSRSVNQLVGLGFGAVYVLVGLLGFVVSGDHAFAGSHGGHLVGVFAVNGLHNVVHLLVGAGLIGGAVLGHEVSKKVNTVVGAVYLLVGVLGLVIGGSQLNVLALNAADHGLHFASALLLIAVGVAADRSRGGAYATR
ncbi:putative membrane protein [Saccharothrix ecbatanensis]|uniref:Putative membrane protein n=1 Tax=Saccharothrix ecbatanensis TaxID=1105145 RepID=A0A7W9HHJ6_9PSEU|nr:DUF4383 domain-containing protein [Saccharothrix ecbatanensis]MBB5802056.1 putative membrane protein [Saccharothrix ecbatanensis]